MRKVLFTGSGNAGSWAIRGFQLGQAVGAKVDANCNSLVGVDLLVVVKRPKAHVIGAAKQRGVPIVWDVVDAWPQPSGNDWDREACMHWLQQQVDEMKPSALVAATEAMAQDCAQFGVPCIALPHHARPGIHRNPIRERVHVVAYEGGLQYLGEWGGVLERECRRRGWRFLVNPPQLAEADIVVAVRQQKGYAARHWKSGVKLANAQGSGTPCVMNRECGYLETAGGGECWADTAEEFSAAFESLVEQDDRMRMRAKLLSSAPHLETIAKRYQEWLLTLKF